jgi:hypothetical protein
MNTALRIACIAAAVATGCSYAVMADRSKVSDNLFQPSAIPDAGADSGDDTGTGDDAEEAGEADAVDEGGDDTVEDAASMDDGASSADTGDGAGD